MRFKKGDIVWAQASGQPIWPARVQKILEKTNTYRVKFYNEETTADLNEKALFDYALFKYKYEKSCLTKKFKEAMKQADLAAGVLRLNSHQQEKESKKKDHSVSLPKKKKKQHTEEKQQHEKVETTKKGGIAKKKSLKNAPEQIIKTEVKEEPVDLDNDHLHGHLQKHQPNHERAYQHSESSPSFSPAFHQNIQPVVKTADDVIFAPRFVTLKHLRTRIDRVLMELANSTEIIPKFTNEALSNLQQIPDLLSRPQLKIEDLLNTKASNMIYFIIKRLGDIPELTPIIYEISQQMKRIKQRILDLWSNTQKFESIFEALEKRRNNHRSRPQTHEQN